MKFRHSISSEAHRGGYRRRWTGSLTAVALTSLSALAAGGVASAANATTTQAGPGNLFTVSPPNQGVAGSTTQVFQSKTPCVPPPGTRNPVVVYGYSVLDQTGPVQRGSFVFAPVDPATGNWTGQYAIGQLMPPGLHTLVAECAAGGPSGTPYQSYSSRSFKVLPGGAPGVAAEKATRVGVGEFLLSGKVAGNNFDVNDWRFEFGPTSSYGSRTLGGGGAAGLGVFPVSETLSGFSPGQTVHYRLVATNANGTTYGSDHQFTEPANPKPPRPADVMVDQGTTSKTEYSSQILHSCSADPLFCGPASVGYHESVSVTWQKWAHRDGTTPMVYYIIKQVAATFFENGHATSEFAEIGNHVTIDDQNPCSGPVTTTNEDSMAQGVAITFDPTRGDGAADRYPINARFYMPTINVNGGGIFDWDVENGTQAFNLLVPVSLSNTCS
jgi:hypothetical protein